MRTDWQGVVRVCPCIKFAGTEKVSTNTNNGDYLYFGGVLQTGDGCNEGTVYPHFDGHSHLPGLCPSLSLHLRCDEENYGTSETPLSASSFTV